MNHQYYWRPIDWQAKSGEEILLRHSANNPLKGVCTGYWARGAYQGKGGWITEAGVQPAEAFDLWAPIPPIAARILERKAA